jgi:hypothetical protein
VGDDLVISFKLSSPFECTTNLLRVLLHPLFSVGFFSYPHCDELSTPPSDFGFQRACNWLFFLAVVIHLVYFYVIYFPIIVAGFSFWCNFCFVFVSL